jgi:cytochrome c6
MSRTACLIVAASLALYSASCFVAPSIGSHSAPPASGAVSDILGAAAPAPETAANSSAFSPLALGAALGLLAAVFGGRPALAVDLENGETIFRGNCAACHAGGNNSIVSEKKLKKEALVTYSKYEVAAIIKQVTNGNGAMPAFGDKLGPDDIEDVANWVFNKADKW